MRAKDLKAGITVKVKDNLLIDTMYGNDTFIMNMEKYKNKTIKVTKKTIMQSLIK